jgi:hypothetical protein
MEIGSLERMVETEVVDLRVALRWITTEALKENWNYD